MKKLFLFFILIIIFLAGYFFLLRRPSFLSPIKVNPPRPIIFTGNPQKICNDNKNNWLTEFKECVGLTKETCEQFKGEYNPCASPCRHNPNKNAMCIQICVEVCRFP